jgi:membrane protease YdiL (CAAX protease family)
MLTLEKSRPGAPILTYLGTTLAISSIFYALIIHAGHLAAASGLYVTALMWSPGIAAIITCKRLGRPLASLGWKWNGRYQVISYVVPIAYALFAYSLTWITGYGAFPNAEVLNAFTTNAGWGHLSSGSALAGYVLLVGTIGMVGSASHALGEEIGWRGFLVPELAKKMSFTKTALLSGVIWAVWHTPVLLFADYNSGTPWWYGLTCFAVMVVGISFPFAWLRLRSGSLWTGVFLHASHNLFIQAIFTPLTIDTGKTKWVIDEFGIALAVTALIVAFITWRLRGDVEPDRAMPLRAAPEALAA